MKERCETIAEHLRARKTATEEEIATCYNQPETGDLGWALTYGDLRALHRQHTPSKGDRGAKHVKADGLILDALRGAPASVSLSAPVNGKGEISVHPKSLNALIELAERDAVIGFYNAGVVALREMFKAEPTPDRAEHLTKAMREVSYQQQVCVWIVTHPGPDVPFPFDITSPQPPDWVGQLSPLDVLLVFRAHQQVNAGRLAALQDLPRGKHKEEPEGRGWGVYLAGLATLLNRTTEQLSREKSLAALFAQSYVHGVEQERQMERAEAK